MANATVMKNFGGKIAAAIVGSGAIGLIGWQLLTSNVFASQSDLKVVKEELRSEMSREYASRQEVLNAFERIETKLDKLNADINGVKVELAEMRRGNVRGNN